MQVTVDELVMLLGAAHVEIYTLKKQLLEEARLRKEAEEKLDPTKGLS